MPTPARFHLKMTLVALVVLGGAAGAAWMQRQRLLVWYCVRGLKCAAAPDVDRWVERVNRLGPEVLPQLMNGLRDPAPSVCANMAAALSARGSMAPPGGLAEQLADSFPSFAAPGHKCAVELIASWLESTPAPDRLPVMQAAAMLVQQVAAVKDSASREAALRFVPLLLSASGNDSSAACRALVSAALTDDDETVRLAALRLAFERKLALAPEAVALMKDPSPLVRRQALAAVGPLPDLVATDDLLAWLYDPDSSVQQVCALALRARGLTDAQLRLARLKASPDARVRLHVLAKLGDAPDLDQGVWLRSLSHDPAPAVRAAAIRFAIDQESCDLSDRLEQMCTNDPCPTVRQLAQYYLSCRKLRVRAASGN